MDLFLKQISCHISIKPKSVPEVPKLFDTEFIQIPEFIYWELFKKIYSQSKVKTLNNILSDISKYNLLSLDVEGYEIEVLKNYDISQHSPEVCIVETHDKNPNFNKTITKYCDEYFYKHNYKKYFSNYINTIYIHQSKYDTLTIFDLS
jgi:hypothetical protein